MTACIQAQAEAAAIFYFLEHHRPRLVNYLDVSLIPATNNAVALVIRRFDQHHRDFCGFESPTDAQRYLAIFEKIYRFTPSRKTPNPAFAASCRCS